MPAYNYKAVDARGKNRKGIIAADSLNDARKRLQAQTLFPLSVEQARASKTRVGGDRIAPKHLSMITRQLATLVEAGTPVEEALRAIAMQSDKQAVKNIFTRLSARVSEGERLSQALKQEGRAFSSLYQSMVAAGEASGNLGAILSRIADYSEKSEQVRSTVQTAMIYPLVLTLVATFVMVIMMTFVVPQVVAQFDNFSAELPFVTRLVIGVSEGLSAYGLWILISIIALVAGFTSLMRVSVFRTRVHGLLLHLPVVGGLIRSVSSARFARTLGTLLDGGSPMLEALHAARETIANQVIKDAVDRASHKVREGSSLSASIKESGAQHFMPLMIYMMAVGEKSGSLAHLMTKVADYLEQEFDGFTKGALSLLEPLIVIIMGTLVGVIVIAIMLPILQLNSLVLT